MYKGKKFNARKETVIGEEYYGIKVSSRVGRAKGASRSLTFSLSCARSSAFTSSASPARPRSLSRRIQSEPAAVSIARDSR